MKVRRRLIGVALVIAGLAGIYVGTYYAVLALPYSAHFGAPPAISTKLIVIDGERSPDFHGVPAAVFAPMQALDAKFIRPDYWRLWPRNAEVDFSSLLSSEKTD